MLSIRYDVIIVIAYSILLWISSGARKITTAKNPGQKLSVIWLKKAKQFYKGIKETERKRENGHMHFFPGY